jgi:hypothetical protein
MGLTLAFDRRATGESAPYHGLQSRALVGLVLSRNRVTLTPSNHRQIA